MANITAMPFRSIDGDRPVSATMDARRFAQYVTNGIDNVSGENALKVSVSPSEFALTVEKGGAVINGYSGWLDESATLYPDAADITYSRIDRVVFRLDLTLNVRYFDLLILKGIPSASPLPPEITRDELIHDIVLADVLIPADTLIIPENAVTDQRGNPELCGMLAASGQKLIKGTGSPTPSTKANIGDAYIDTSVTPHAYYLCLGIDGNTYIWKRMGYMSKKLITEIITASTTWVTPNEFIFDEDVRILVFGGGGGGGSGSYKGGGGGGYMNQYTGKINDAPYVITIGSGGAVGKAGGTTSFGTIVSASGGGGADSNGNGGSGGTGGGSSMRSTAGSGTYGGGGGGYKGGNGGTYGGGGGSGANGAGNGGTYGGNGGAWEKNGKNGTDTTGIAGLDFVGSGTAGVSNGYGGGGGGGYGGNGGNGGSSNNGYSGGGGGYGGNGGNGGTYSGGGGGGYGGNGKNGSSNNGGGGGGYGVANYGSGGNGGNAGTAGVCVIKYYVYDLT